MASDKRLSALAELNETTNAWNFGKLPDGAAMPIHRPLAVDYSLPDRGTEAHGVDNDVPSDDMTGNDDILIAPPEPYNGPEYIQELVPPKPIPVSVIDMPYRSELVFTDLYIAMGDRENYNDSKLYVPDRNTIRPIAPYDDTRDKLVLSLGLSTDAIVGNTAVLHYAFAVSTLPEFSSYIVIGGQLALSQWPAPVIIEGKGAVYGALIPLLAANEKPNQTVLNANATRRQVVNQTL